MSCLPEITTIAEISNNSPAEIDAADAVPHKADARRGSDWDIRNASRNYLISVGAQAVIGGSSFLAAWLLTHSIGSDGYGAVVAFLVGSQLLQVFTIWTCTALARFGVTEYIETGKIIGTFWSRASILIPNLLLAVLTAPLWMGFLGPALKIDPTLYVAVILQFAFLSVQLHIVFGLQAAKLAHMQVVVQAAEKALTGLLLIAMFVTGSLTIHRAAWAYVAGIVLSALIGIFMLRPYLAGRIAVSYKRVAEIIKFSLPLPLHSVFVYLSLNHVDAIFIVQYLPLSALAVYSVAYQANGLLMQAPMLIGNLMLPFFVTLDSEDEGNARKAVVFREIVPVLMLGLSAVCIAGAISAYLFAERIFGPDFEPTGKLLWIFGVAAVLFVPNVAGFTPLLNSEGKTRTLLVASIAAATVNVALDIALIPMIGLEGAAWATVSAFIATMTVFSLALRQRKTYGFRQIAACGLPIFISAVSLTLNGGFLFATGLFIATAAIVILSQLNTMKSGSVRLWRLTRRR